MVGRACLDEARWFPAVLRRAEQHRLPLGALRWHFGISFSERLHRHKKSRRRTWLERFDHRQARPVGARAAWRSTNRPAWEKRQSETARAVLSEAPLQQPERSRLSFQRRSLLH